MDIATKQIKNKIEGKTVLNMLFTDAEAEIINLYEQTDGYYIKPVFKKTKKLSRDKYLEIINFPQSNTKFCTDIPDTDSNMKYDEFFNNYYN